MRLATSIFTALVLSSSLIACVDTEEDGIDEDLGDIGDGKSDSFGIVDKKITIEPGHYRRFSFGANAGFRIAVTQPDTAVADRSTLAMSLKSPDATKTEGTPDVEPAMVVDSVAGQGSFSLTIKNVGDKPVSGVLNVRPLGGFGKLPDPNAAVFPDASWQPPATSEWPSSYVIFNNTGCGHDCTQTDSTALAPRAVMIKMLVTAIKEVKQDGIVRVSNFNISGSASVKPVVDALVWAMTERHATVRIVMDSAQNNAMSKTTWLAMNGAEVRFLDGIHYQNGSGTDSVGIMHSKIVAVDDQIIFTGSNNFSSTGLVTNEENSVVLRGPSNASRIGSFTCDIDTMFEAGVEMGKAQKTDAERRDSIIKLDQCNGGDVWFPPSGQLSANTSYTYNAVTDAIAGAKKSISIAPDMMAHPGLISALVTRAKKAKSAGQAFSIKLVLDASSEALGNPAFGECLTDAAKKYDLDVQIRYWPGTAEIFQLMHHKFMIVDADDPSGATLYNGSANYSAKALRWSFENVTRYRGAEYRQVVEAFAARFATMFSIGKTAAKLSSEDHITAPACVLSI